MNYDNKNLRPKTFFVTMERNRNGSFTVKKARVLNRANQYSRTVKRVDARDLRRALITNDITVA
jgi:hypothetical protein